MTPRLRVGRGGAMMMMMAKPWSGEAVEYVVEWRLEHRNLGPIQAIGVDEIQYAKGHKYLTLVYQIEKDCTRLLCGSPLVRACALDSTLGGITD
jgi:hypothetical protein